MLLVLTVSSRADLVYHAGTTRKMLQMTGDTDTALRCPTLTHTYTNAGVYATDLGSSFVHNGLTYFYFGDTYGSNFGGVADVMGYSSATSGLGFSSMSFRMNGSAARAIDVPGITEGGLEVPSGAVSAGGYIYLVQTTAYNGVNMTKSVMARSSNLGDSWTNLYTLSQGNGGDMTNAHFINVSMRKVSASAWPGLPWTSGNVVLIWGAGAYRTSNVYLAAIPENNMNNKSYMRYLSGFNGSTPVWSTSETAAIPLFTQPCMGEFSAGWIAQQNCWLFMYPGGDYGTAARGIQIRTAAKPWGPYSANPTTIMTPGDDQAYPHYMHWGWAGPWYAGHQDKIQDGIMAWYNGNNDDEFGGEYGGYLIENFTTGDATNTQIYYTMSTWNPYQTLLMRSDIGPAATTAPPDSVTETLTLGDATWNKSGTTWYGATTIGGIPGISTWTSQGDASTGIMWRWLYNDQWNKQLTFNITSGNGEVILLEGGGDIPTTGDITTIYNNIKAGVYGKVVEATWGHEDNNIVIPVTWKLAPYDRARLKVVVIDYSTLAWSFVGVSNMTLTSNVPTVGTSNSTIMPGDASWTKSAGTWFANETHLGVLAIHTYCPNESGQGVMWYKLPRDWKNKQLQFYTYGGHCKVFLLEGGNDVPISGTFSTIQSDIIAGKYGVVRQTVTGPEDNGNNYLQTWNLETVKSSDLKVVFIDADTGPWGFMGLSQMTLTRYN